MQQSTPVVAQPGDGPADLTAKQLRQRQEELDRRAAELAAREAELNRAQRLVQREHNFPPLPSFLPCTPCFYQDINVEIEVTFQSIVRQAYKLWLRKCRVFILRFFIIRLSSFAVYVVTLLVNSITCLAAWSEDVDGGAGMFLYSLVTVVLYTPISFVCWFRPLYKAFRDDSSFSFMIFFFVFFCQLVMSVIWAVGFPWMGAM